MPIDWNKAEEYNKFKPYIEDGKFKVKCNGVEIKEVGSNGSVIMKFKFDDTDNAQYPTADHWMSFKNTNFRGHHNRCILRMFGLTEEQAKKSVDLCEKTDNKDEIIKAYQKIFDKLLAKKPEVEIEVYTDGDYVRAEFTDRTVRMNDKNSNTTTAAQKEVLPSDIEVDGGDINMDDVPF